MSKSAAEIEADIRRAWQSRRLKARGLWMTIRDLIEHGDDKRPGFLLQNGRPMRTEDVANLANTSVTMAGTLLGQLESVKLVTIAADGAIFSKPLASLYHRREVLRRNTKACRSRRGVLRNTQGGITSAPCNTHVIPDPPPSVSPPITPSSTSPSPVCESGAAIEARRDAERVSAARSLATGWLTKNRPDLLRRHDDFRDLILETGSLQAALAECAGVMEDPTKRNPFAYVLTKIRARAAPATGGRPPAAPPRQSIRQTVIVGKV